MGKREIKIFLFVCVLIFAVQHVSSFGLSPAIKSYNFEPGMETSVTYYVRASSDEEVEIFANGDLAQYVSFDKKTAFGGESFTATIKLPKAIEKPGQHRIGIGIGQKIDPELAAGFIGTRIVVIGAVDIYVPFPGRYLEINLKGHDVNVNEPVNFNLDIASQGVEDVNVTPKIEIYSDQGLKDTLIFNTRTIKSQESLTLTKPLSTVGYNPGRYKAIAIVDYGSLATSETDFRIGELVINMVSYTNKMPISKIQKFEIGVESGWNDKIDGAYADVSFLNGTQLLTNFKTTSTSLTPWENKTIIGYVDTENFTEGVYDANITLIYYGKEQGKSNSQIVKVELYKTKSMLLWYIIAGVGLLIIVSIILVKILRKNHGKKKK